MFLCIFYLFLLTITINTFIMNSILNLDPLLSEGLEVECSEKVVNPPLGNKKEIHLVDFFDCPRKHGCIMEIMVKKGYCHANTYIWIDHHGGFKKFIICFLKLLHALGYYKNNKELSSCQIMEICQNDFGVTTRPEYIRKIQFDDSVIGFIPQSNDLKMN